MRIIPNAIAVVRGLAIVPVVVLIDQGDMALAAAVFVAAALTDAIDGPVARRYGAVSPAGALLDPLADKVLILGTFLALLGRGAVAEWVVAVLFSRELLAVGLRAVAAGRGIPVPAGALGKAKMVMQAVAASLALIHLASSSQLIAVLAEASLVVAVVLTIGSGLDLLRRALSLLPGRIGVHAR